MTYTSTEVCQLAGVTYRQLDYWNRTGLIHPSEREAAGSGTRRLWNDDDLLAVRKIRIASELSQGTLQDCIDKLDSLLSELSPSVAA